MNAELKTSHGRETNTIFIGLSPDRKPRSLIAEPYNVEPFQSYIDIPYINGLRESAVIDIDRRHGELVQQLKRISKTDMEYEFGYAELIERAKCSEIAERIVNGVKVEFTQRLDSTGVEIYNVYEDPQHPDHGRPHVRRVKNTAHYLGLTYPEFRHEGFREFLMVALFSEFHDKAQIPALLWNKNRPKQEHIKIKAGHAEEGGIIVELLDDAIQKHGHMSETMAKQVSALSSILIFVHDIPERMIERLHGTVKANWINEAGELKSLPDKELFTHYVAGDLNMFTTSPAQRIKIMRHVKGLKGVMDKSHREWGLDPEIEVAYQNKLKAMADDIKPTFLDVPQEILDCATDAATICLLADMKDMMSPVHAHVRKFNVDASKARNIYKADKNAFDRITGSIGDDTESDYERAMWEVFEFLRIVKKSRLWNNPDIRNVLINTALDSFVQTNRFYSELMRGEDGFGIIQMSFAERIYEAGMKALKKSGVSAGGLKQIRTELEDVNNPEVLKDYFLTKLRGMKKKKSQIFHRRFGNRAVAIEIESEEAILRLREKPNAHNGLAFTYSSEDMLHRANVENRLYAVFCEIAQISPDEIQNRLSNRTLTTLVTGGFDPVGGISDVKTLIPLSQAQMRLLEELDL